MGAILNFPTNQQPHNNEMSEETTQEEAAKLLEDVKSMAQKYQTMDISKTAEDYLAFLKIEATQIEKFPGAKTPRAISLVEMVLRKTCAPDGWSANSNATYFREKHALKLRIILDAMAEDKMSDRVLESKKFGMMKHTLRTFVDQAWKYLIKHMDTPERKYATLKAMIKATAHPHGLKLRWVYDEPVSEDGYLGKTVERELEEFVEAPANKSEKDLNKHIPKFKDDLIAFIEGAPDESKFERVKLDLNPDQLEYIEDLVDGVEGLIKIELTSSNVKLFKSMHFWREMQINIEPDDNNKPK